MMSLLIRILALIGLLWTGKKVAHQVSALRRPVQPEKENASDRELTGELMKDPVCQTYIPASLAIQRKIQGELYYFCGEECASKFVDSIHHQAASQDQTEEP